MRLASKAHDGQTAVVSYCLVLTFLTVGNVDGAAIHCQDHLEAGWGIKAHDAIIAGGAIRVGESLQTDGEIRAGDGYGVYAGLVVQLEDWATSAQVRARSRPKRLMSGWWTAPDPA